MRVGIFGSRDWVNYSELVRQLTLFIQESHEIGHDGIIFVHSANKGAENMITEYIGKTEKFLRQKQFKIKEDIYRGNAPVVNDMNIVESGIDFALIFSTGCKRTTAFQRVLKEYNVPFRLVESA